MSSNFKVLQVIPRLGFGGAETGCYDIAHYLTENNCGSFVAFPPVSSLINLPPDVLVM